jgi:uncharacterized protein YgbK (DUF1537 family)
VPEPLAEIRRLSADRLAIVADDDPTGTQTVHDVEVVTRWTTKMVRKRFATAGPGFFVLTNSRSLDEASATDLGFRLGRRLRAESARANRAVSLISRSDSTLRGHFPAEVDALAEGFGLERARVLLVPFFGEAGRITRDDVHYVRVGETLTPVGETEFAKDGVFGFRSSNLLDWIEEKAPGRPARSIGLTDLRSTSGDAVRVALADSPPGGICVVNAVEQRDVELAALGALRAQLEGVEVIARTAASYVRARFGQSLGRSLRVPTSLDPLGVVVVGSHVPTTSVQLERLLERPPGPVELIELDIDALVCDPASADSMARAAATRVDEAIRRGVVPVVATSRRLLRGSTPERDLRIGTAVSQLLVATIRKIRSRPGWVLAKGGITSSDIAVHAIGVSEATVLGQIAPGVSAWRAGNDSRFPGLFYVVFPGNVGDPDALRSVCARLMGVERDE